MGCKSNSNAIVFKSVGGDLWNVICDWLPCSSSPPAGGRSSSKRSTMSATANSDWPTPSASEIKVFIKMRAESNSSRID